MLRVLLVFLSWTVLAWNSVLSQDPQKEMRAKLACVEATSCGACLAAAKHCRWCADPYMATTTTPRCNDEYGLLAANCSQYSIQKPRPSSVEVLQDDPLSDWLPDHTAIQLTPQKIKVSLRPKESQSIKVAYRPAKNYPLDLYYLMDLTVTMKDDVQTLVSLSDEIPRAMKNLTEHFRVGFGSFAEKPVMPFTGIGARDNPCKILREVCEPVYSFRHRLSLTEETSEFIRRVNESKVTANLDNAESGLEALMQTAVCGNRIGWSDVSRKIAIVLTDGLLHHAGDGILGGLTKLNDEKCHLDDEGYYTASEYYDYPSYQQMYRVLREHKLNVIFAVTEEVKQHYDALHGIWSENIYIGRLDADSSNILNLIKKGYEDLVSVVDLKSELLEGPEVDVEITSDCEGGGGRCTGVGYGTTYEFEVKFTMSECPKYQHGQKAIVQIQETHLGQDSLEVEIELICGCSCEEDDKLNSYGTCPMNAAMKCGQCQCTEDWVGPNCDCRLSDDTALQLVNSCIENVTTSHHGMIQPACSGAGDCVCGTCLCDRGFHGKFCQCQRCPLSKDGNTYLECGGGSKGSCVCGECICNKEWSGAACDCTTDLSTCIAPQDKNKTDPSICSGRGRCRCGECVCDASENGVRASGEWCESCTDCDNPVCSRASVCVMCHVLKAEGADVDACKTQCNDVLSYTVNFDVTEEDIKKIKRKQLTWCISRYERDERTCETSFAYGPGVARPNPDVDDGSIPLLVAGETCQKPRAATLFLGGLFISLMVVGVGLVVATVVKISTVIAERREYQKWKIEADKAALNSREINPLYVSPITSYNLPSDFPRDKFD